MIEQRATHDNKSMQTTQRPVFLSLWQIRLPIAGVMSILHRITGTAMALALPWLLYLFERSLQGSVGFDEVRTQLAGVAFRLGLFIGLWTLIHHLLAGIRFLLIDIEIGVDRPAYRYSAWAVVIAAPLLALLVLGGL